MLWRKPPDLVLLDMRMPGMSGEEVFARLHEAHPGVPIVFLTAFGSVESAVLAMRNGAFDYLQKPFRREELLLVVKRALSHADLEHEVERLKGRLEALGESDHPQSRSAVMLDLTDKARRAAATDATVMILGESGTGKEVMARYIHSQSRRKNRPYVPVECKQYEPSSEPYYYYRQWRRDGTWEAIQNALRTKVRHKAGRHKSPSAAIIDSQTVKTTEMEAPAATTRASESRDVNGTSWLIPWVCCCAVVHSAGIQDPAGASSCWPRSWAGSRGCG